MDLTATIFKAVINDSAIAAATAEYIIDLAISEINNIAQTDLPVMSGAAGSKTVSLQTKEYGPVMDAARAIYYGFYKGLEPVTVGGFTVTSPDLQSNATVREVIEKAARQLAEFDVDYG